MTPPITAPAHTSAGVDIRPASFDDAAFLCGLVSHLGCRLPRIGPVPADDPFAVIDAMWHRAAAVFLAGLPTGPFAVVTIYDLDLLHRTAWIEAHHDPDLPPQLLDIGLWAVIEHAHRAWNLRTIRTLDAVAEVPLFATFGERARFEGEIPGGCPGASPSTGALRALDLEATDVD